MPDDLTLSQLEMTVRTLEKLRKKGLYPGFSRDYILTIILDGSDGLLARHLKLSSPEGAMKDVVVDRLSETLLAKYITERRRQYTGFLGDEDHSLMTAFSLSTLTKAACEICGITTKEGGIGGMIERRRILFETIKCLSLLDKNSHGNAILEKRLLKRVDKNILTLINGSRFGAIRRINAIAEINNKGELGWTNQDLNNPDSSSAIEARKYVAVVRMYRALGIDIIDFLNQVAAGKTTFPSAESLAEKYPYIERSFENISDFFNHALSIAEGDEIES